MSAQSSPKYIFVTGGVVSSLGKGIAAAAIGRLLVSRGLTIGIQKLDPYINVDPGTMSPHEHGEVFVTEDGAETDLDLGHYERFTNTNTSKASNVTAGGIYDTILRRERRGDFEGRTVQVVPHITNEIKNRIKLIAESQNVDVVITEIGGTVGDIESLPFLEAIRQMPSDVGRRNCMFIHLTLVPYIKHAGELKTKPTQHSVNELRRIGIQPDMLLCRSESALSRDIRSKIALFTALPTDMVISAKDVGDVYEIPTWYLNENVDDRVLDHFGIEAPPADISDWERVLSRTQNATDVTKIALVGKYVKLEDAYKSVSEAMRHAGALDGTKIEIEWVDSEQLTDMVAAERLLSGVDGIILPGGFGGRGIEGMVVAAQYARERKVPYLGICLGMQIAVCEFARNIAQMPGANSTEFDKETEFPVVDLLPEQKEVVDLGGTLRKGSEPVKLVEGTLISGLYDKQETIYERHRHRYEVSLNLRPKLEEAGLTVSGTSPDGRLVEAIEIKDHPFYVAAQYHPEFKSRPELPAPLFKGFVKAAHGRSKAGTDQVERTELVN